MTASGKGKQSSMFCLADVFAQLLVMKCCSMMMPLFRRIDASHDNKLHSVSKGNVSHIICDLAYLKACMR